LQFDIVRFHIVEDQLFAVLAFQIDAA
jgi:hypothetical protein